MRNEGCGRETDCFVVPFEAFLELHNQALEQKLTHIGELCIDDGDHSSIYWCEGQTCSLRFHDASAE